MEKRPTVFKTGLFKTSRLLAFILGALFLLLLIIGFMQFKGAVLFYILLALLPLLFIPQKILIDREKQIWQPQFLLWKGKERSLKNYRQAELLSKGRERVKLHTLNGSASFLAVDDAEGFCHTFNEALNAVSQGEE